MKREVVLLVLVVFLIVFMIRGVSASNFLQFSSWGECELQNKTTLKSGIVETDTSAILNLDNIGNLTLDISRVLSSIKYDLDRGANITRKNSERFGFVTYFTPTAYLEMASSNSELIGSYYGYLDGGNFWVDRDEGQDYGPPGTHIVDGEISLVKLDNSTSLQGPIRIFLYYNTTTKEPYKCHILMGHFLYSSNRQDYKNRISALESNMTLLQSWKQTISTTITNLIATITGHTTEIDNQETRIVALESSGGGSGGSGGNASVSKNYFKYLSSSDRKSIVCGYGEDNHLTSISDLGFNCTITYRTSRNNVTSTTCKCKEIK